jgi:hypothetical protein
MFPPALFAIRRKKQLVADSGLARCRALLPSLVVSIDGLVLAVHMYYQGYR